MMVKKKLTFQLRVILSNIMITLFIMFTVIFIFYRSTSEALMARALDDFKSLANKTTTQFETLMYHMDRTALQIAANPTIIRFFMEVDQIPDNNYFIDHPLITQDIIKILNSYNFKEDAFSRICLYNELNDFVYTANTMTTTTAIENFFTSSAYEFVTNTFKNQDVFYMYRPPQPDTLNDSNLPSPPYFSFIREIKDYYTNNSPYGYVEVQQSVAMMDDMFSDLGQNTYVLLFNHLDEFIYHSPNLEPSLLNSIDPIESFMINNKASSQLQETGDYYFSVLPIKEGNLNLLFIKNKAVILAPIHNFKFSLIVATLAVVLVAIVSNYLIIDRLSKPLSKLQQSIRQINIHNLKLDLNQSEVTDELMQLNLTFNQMLTQLQASISQQIILETNVLKSHLFALQSQMNPHFMHNILAIISMEALTSGNIKTTKICSKLCKMLKFTSSMGDGTCSLEEELLNAKHYMELMQERYEDLFVFSIQIDEEAKQIQIPKLIIQPICENCFQHGFKSKEPIWTIHLHAYVVENEWFIAIQDNGNGFSDSYLNTFHLMVRQLTMDNVEEKMKHTTIGGLCIVNIFMRLKIYYQDEFTLKLLNHSEGATVLLGGKINV